MRIERVIAHAFGPLEGASLELAPGLTVVTGPNESGKSSWHAAIRAAMCGTRRGRGANTKAEAAFEERHRPWDGDGRWEVEARLALDDGRTIDIHQDLAGKVACRATDVVLGRDVSDEIMDGTPDASRWLGLDRDAFAATICVGQAQLAAIAGRESAAALQEHMQRAAATRGTDATAAEARARLEEFRRERVGLDRQNARGPLRTARLRAETMRAARDEARARHDAYLDASALAEAAERMAVVHERRTASVEAAIARQAAQALRQRLERARTLVDRYPTEPPGTAVRDGRADAVAAALDAWRRRPRPEPLTGETAAELEAQLAAIPDRPDGDLEVHHSVAAARRALDRAEDALVLLGDEPRPADTEAVASDDASPTVVRWVGAALAAAAAVGALSMGLLVVAAMAAVGAVALAAWGLAGGHDGGSQEGERLRDDVLAWTAKRDALQARRSAAADSLAAELRARGVEPGDDLASAYAAYEEACRGRAARASRAEQRVALQQAVAARRAAESAAAESARAVGRAQAALTAAAESVGAVRGDPAEMVAALEAWQRDHRTQTARADAARREWHELTTLLAGRPIDALSADAEAADARAESLAARADATQLGALVGRDDLDALLRVEREELDRARQAASSQRGALEQMLSDLPDVAEAEEALAEATAELERVRDLAAVLETTAGLLRAAEERVHRDLAPVLARSITRWLPRVSGGAYLEASVDPADLSVRVRQASTGRWRSALLLSEGTREQIYLLLRVAMAQQLATTGETAPLLLDEVTAQADSIRRRELLEVIHELSAERQIVLFSHDDDVAAWAAATLDGVRDRALELGAERQAALS